jgi:hypothetical protein
LQPIDFKDLFFAFQMGDLNKALIFCGFAGTGAEFSTKLSTISVDTGKGQVDQPLSPESSGEFAGLPLNSPWPGIGITPKRP